MDMLHKIDWDNIHNWLRSELTRGFEQAFKGSISRNLIKHEQERNRKACGVIK